MARQDILTATLTGTLVREPEDISDGKGAKFAIACNESWYDKTKNEAVEYVSYLDVVVWGGMARPCLNFLVKGSRVAVVARPKQERWEGKEGKRASRVTFHASTVMFLDKKGEAPSRSVNTDNVDDGDEEIPF